MVTFATFSGLLAPREVFANNLKISNVTLEDRDQTANTVVVEFDISWENSWKTNVNHDAVWVVLKAKVGSSTYWTHLPLYTANTTAGVNPFGYSRGTDNNIEIYVPYNNGGSDAKKGAYIRRSTAGTGAINSQNVRLIAHYGGAAQAITDSTSIRVQVVGVEMVFVPQGSFRAGDGALTGNYSPFSDGAQVSSITQSTYPWYISTEGSIVTTTTSTGPYFYTAPATSEYQSYGSGYPFTIKGATEFPKGYTAFYAMKYEVTEGLYVDYLNMLDTLKQATHDPTAAALKNSDSVKYRNTVSGGTPPTTFSTSRPDRPMSYMRWTDFVALMDWLSLRPMSELEFEKLARGTAYPVTGEFAWGTATVAANGSISTSPEDGTEVTETAGANAAVNAVTYTDGDAFLGTGYRQGPVRAGFFATDSTTRVTSGAGYYGTMELTGNLAEYVVYVARSQQYTFTPMAGDGELSSAGYANMSWGNTGSVIDNNYFSGLRGGSFMDADDSYGYLEVSGRKDCCLGDRAVSYHEYGGRGVRSCQDTADCTN